MSAGTIHVGSSRLQVLRLCPMHCATHVAKLTLNVFLKMPKASPGFVRKKARVYFSPPSAPKLGGVLPMMRTSEGTEMTANAAAHAAMSSAKHAPFVILPVKRSRGINGKRRMNAIYIPLAGASSTAETKIITNAARSAALSPSLRITRSIAANSTSVSEVMKLSYERDAAC